MSFSKQGVEWFNRGYNCAQSVFVPHALALGIDRDTALKVPAGFGGGMVRRGETCGALSGALMALGLYYGQDSKNPPESKEKCYSLCQRFIEDFEKRKKSINCSDLMGFDMSDPGLRSKAGEQGKFDTICTGLVEFSLELLEEYLPA